MKIVITEDQHKRLVKHLYQPDGISCGPTCIKMVGDFFKGEVDSIDEICKGLEGVLAQEQIMFGDITRMSETRFDDVIKESVTRQLFGIKPEVDLYDNDAISTNLRNKMSRFYIDLNGELQGKGDNMWGLFSGVTKYTTHSLTKNDNTEVKMFGKVGVTEQSIFNKLVELV